MKCNHCNHEIKQPLELYDGAWACPRCRKYLFDMQGGSQSFKITPDNDELFQLSELYYFHWLSGGSEEELKNAITFCRQAAYAGHPGALTRLGYYYDKDYDEVNRSESVRCRFAYRCYMKVCRNGLESNTSKSTFDFEGWQKYTAILLTRMLQSAPEDVRMFVKHDLSEIRDIASRYGVPFNERAVQYMSATEEEGLPKSCEDFLKSMKSNVRAPLIGVFRLTVEQFAMLLAKGSKGGLYERVIKGKANIIAVPSSDECYHLNTAKSMDDFVSDYAEETITLIVVNHMGKHLYLNGSAIDTVYEALTAEDREDGTRDALALELHTEAKRYHVEMVLFDDDVHYFKNNLHGSKNYITSEAVRLLIHSICQERD